MKNNQLFEILIAGAIAVGLNYVNQFFTWNFESLNNARVSFTIFSVLYVGLLVYYTPRLFRLLRRINLNPSIISEANIIHKYFHYGKSLFMVVVSIGLFLIYLFSFFQFSNYSHFKKELLQKQNDRSVKSYIYEVEEEPEEMDWVIVNNLLNEKGDDETNAFAINFQNSLEKKIQDFRLPIVVKEDKQDGYIDSLLRVKEVVYVIYGTYLNGIAEIYIDRKFKRNNLSFYFYGTGLPIGHEKSPLDSMISLFENKKIYSEERGLNYDSDNATLSKYNLKIGVPNEINYIVGITLAEFITQGVNKDMSLYFRQGNLPRENTENRVDLALSLLDLVEESIPLEVNFLGTRPKIRSGININNLYSLQLNLRTIKLKFLLGNNITGANLSESKKKHALTIIKNAQQYFDKIPNSIDLSNDKNIVQSTNSQMKKIYFLETHQSFYNALISTELKKLGVLINQYSGSDEKPILGGSGANFSRLTKPKVDALLEKYESIEILTEQAQDLISQSIKYQDKINDVMNTEDFFENQSRLKAVSAKIMKEMLNNEQGMKTILSQIHSQKNQLESFKRRLN